MSGFFKEYRVFIIAPLVLAVFIFLVLFVFVDFEEESITYIFSWYIYLWSARIIFYKSISVFTLIELLIVIAIVDIPQCTQYKIKDYNAHSK